MAVSVRPVASGVAAFIVGALGCSPLSGLSDGNGGGDAGDAAVVDAQEEPTGDASDQGGDGDGAADALAPTTYNDLTDASAWSVFDLGVSGYWGGTFDGRYVYFAPTGTVAVRYDTQAAFDVVNSWSTFDLTALGPSARGFRGAVFDGRYVYFVPSNTGIAESGVVVRVDTQAAFTSTSSWTSFDAATLTPTDGGGPQAKGFIGGVFDGRYVYLVPNGYAPTKNDGLVVRYDSQAAFAAIGSWSTFNAAAANPASAAFWGGVFDGNYVYFINSDCCASLTRYDSRLPFNANTSWTTFDTRTINSGPQGFAGAAFDGRHVYLVPDGQGSWNGLVTRYDTTSSFALPRSFQTFDMSTVDSGAKGFLGGAFDGRFVYFVPYLNTAIDGLVARYDTQGGFTTVPAWSTFDATTLNASAKGFAGAIFDGRYVYFVPHSGAVVVRFDAKTPPSMPPGYSGSFL